MSSFIDGSIGSDDWYYSIGKYYNASDGWNTESIPGPGKSVKEVYIWMKTHSMKDNSYMTCKKMKCICSYRSMFYIMIIKLLSY